ncbi:MAG TPA: glycosyl hydrolase family 28-related protein [Paucimonas sp.]|nr:glycosyl hydrolase family 28-related protein [Paucimonas sp.]
MRFLFVLPWCLLVFFSSAAIAFDVSTKEEICSYIGKSFANDPPPARVSWEACPSYPPSQTCTGPSCLSGGVCRGANRHLDSAACVGAACCRAGSVSSGNRVNVEAYLNRVVSNAAPDSSVDDAPGIAEAVECASSLSATERTVYFPAGKYLVRTPIRPNYSNMAFTGPDVSAAALQSGAAASYATIRVEPCNPEQFPGAFQLSDLRRADGSYITTSASGVKIQNFKIELTNGPRGGTSNSGIQLNRCTNCLVQDIWMKYDETVGGARMCKPSNLDGITFALGSGGSISDSVLDGIPKAGIYVNTIEALYGAPPVTVENNEVKNTSGPFGGVGVGIVSPNVTLRNNNIHHNGYATVDSAGTWHYKGAGMYIVTAPETLGSVPNPANIGLYDNLLHHNYGTGLLIGSQAPQHRPSNIAITDLRTYANLGHGMSVEAGTNIAVTKLRSWGNGYFGLTLTSKTTFPAGSLRVDGVTFTDTFIVENTLEPNWTSARPSVWLQAGGVSINGGKAIRCTSDSEQRQGVVQYSWTQGVSPNQVSYVPTNNSVTNFDISGL